jgi:hypothetical protein
MLGFIEILQSSLYYVIILFGIDVGVVELKVLSAFCINSFCSDLRPARCFYCSINMLRLKGVCVRRMFDRKSMAVELLKTFWLTAIYSCVGWITEWKGLLSFNYSWSCGRDIRKSHLGRWCIYILLLLTPIFVTDLFVRFMRLVWGRLMLSMRFDRCS